MLQERKISLSYNFFQIFTSSNLKNYLKTYFASLYPRYSLIEGQHFLYFKDHQHQGNPAMLVAHMDTYFQTPPWEFFFHGRDQTLTSPQGLGADDRAGIIAILEIIKNRLSFPDILFTDLEEVGSIGAQEAAEKLKSIVKVNFIIQLDRQGENEAVFYDCENQVFKKHILAFGYKEAPGTRTDICVLCPKWDVAGVNLSIGYYHPHSTGEYLNLIHLEKNISRIQLILDKIPAKVYSYQPYDYIISSCSDLPSWMTTPYE